MSTPNIDPDILTSLTRNDSAEAALPCNLSEESLLQIAADLRTVELLRANDDDRNPPIVRPLYLLSRLMVAEAKKIAANSECAIPHERLDH